MRCKDCIQIAPLHVCILIIINIHFHYLSCSVFPFVHWGLLVSVLFPLKKNARAFPFSSNMMPLSHILLSLSVWNLPWLISTSTSPSWMRCEFGPSPLPYAFYRYSRHSVAASPSLVSFAPLLHSNRGSWNHSGTITIHILIWVSK